MVDWKKNLWGSIAFLFLFCLFIPAALSFVEINELMYNPIDCSDSKCEWIELYNPLNETVSLENCSIDSKQIGNHNISNQSYVILVRDRENFIGNFGYNNDSPIIEMSFSLSNSGENLVLEGSDFCNDSINYSTQIDTANGNNYSLEKFNENYWNKSFDFGGSAGSVNSILTQEDVLIINESNNSSDLNGSTDRCDFDLQLYLNNSLTSSTDFAFSVAVQDNFDSENNVTNSSHSIVGKIINFDGQIIKEYYPLTNQSYNKLESFYYSPNLENGIYFLNFEVEDINCNDSDKYNNKKSGIFAISSEISEQINLSNALPQLCATELGTENTEPVQEVGQTDSGGGHGSNGDRVSDTNNSGDSSESIHSNSSLMIDKFDNEYQFLEVPNKVYENEKIDLEIAVKSMDNSAHDYLAHAYLYKGAFCYSCNNKSLERDENKISFSVAVDEVNYQKFELILDKEINPGDYKIKVKFQKDDRKTFDEITTNISIVKREEIMENVSNGSENSTEVLDLTAFDLPDKQQNSDTGSTVDLIESEESSEDGNESATSEPNTSSSSFGSRITGAITNPLVYQSTGSRAKLLVPGLIIVSCLVMMILVWKKKF